MNATNSQNEGGTTDSPRPIVPTRALLSVSDKAGLAEFAQRLEARGVELFSTGGTSRSLLEAGCRVKDVSGYTGFPEMMDGRLKTLHPKVFGGILARRNRADDMASLADHEILPFDLVVVNLYPFERTVSAPAVQEPEAIEQIDIGGPSLVRAAAKNYVHVAILTDPSQYAWVEQELEAEGVISLALRRRLAAAAFARTAEYDRAIADYFTREQPFPEFLGRTWRHHARLRYGENPHQQGALYIDPGSTRSSLVNASQLCGKELSYNNYLDLDAAWRIVRDQEGPTVAVIKHNNPCGVSTSGRLEAATKQALDCDPVSAFGSVLGINRPVDVATAEILATPGLFIETIVAPQFVDDALEVLRTKPKWKDNVRLLAYGAAELAADDLEVRPIDGGALVQQRDALPSAVAEWKVVTDRAPDESELIDSRFAWSVVRHVRSNGIVIARDRTAWGVGAGQMSRVDAVEIAIAKAGRHAQKSALASDAFFPFPDSIERSAAAGVTALIQPGGSRNDDQVIAAANKEGMAMVFTGRRHFRH